MSSLPEALHDLANAITKADVNPDTKPLLKLKMDEIALKHREPGQSPQQSFAKIFTSDPIGVTILKRYNDLRGPGYYKPSRQV